MTTFLHFILKATNDVAYVWDSIDSIPTKLTFYTYKTNILYLSTALFMSNLRSKHLRDQRCQSGLKSGRSWPRVKKFRFSRKIFEKFRFFQAIPQTKNRFFRANFRNFVFSQVILQKNSIFQVKFPKNFEFLRQFSKIFRFSREISETFRFFQAISPKKIKFSGHI